MRAAATIGYGERLSERPTTVQRALNRVGHHRRALIAAASILTTVVLWVMAPAQGEFRSYVCRDCGLERHESKSSIMSVRYSARTTYRRNLSAIYDRYVATPHVHDWIGDRYSVQARSAFSRSCGVGYTESGRWPRSQIEVTQAALMWIEQLAATPEPERQVLYGRMLLCATPKEVDAIASKAVRDRRGAAKRTRRDLNPRPAV